MNVAAARIDDGRRYARASAVPASSRLPFRVVKSGRSHVFSRVTREAEDNALVESARRGDTEAFAALYERYRTDVWNFALLTLRHREDAEDSVQETFLKAYRALHQYRRGESIRPWLLTICRNVCLDRLRAAPRRSTMPLDDDGV